MVMVMARQNRGHIQYMKTITLAGQFYWFLCCRWPAGAVSQRAIIAPPHLRVSVNVYKGEGQNCTGQKCTEHELVLLMFFVLNCLDDLL